MPEPVVLHAVVLDLGMVFVGTELESHEVAKVATPGILQFCENVVRRARHPQVDVLRGAGALEPEFEHEAARERHGIAQHGDDAREEPVEHQELALASELGATLRGRSEALLEGLLERLGR